MSGGAKKDTLLLVLRRTDEPLDPAMAALRRIVATVPESADLRASAYFRTSTGAAALLLIARGEGFEPETALLAAPDLQKSKSIRPLVIELGRAQAMLSGFDVHLGDRLDPIDALTVIQEAARSGGSPSRERRRARRFPGPSDLIATLAVDGVPHRGAVSNVALSGCFVACPPPFPKPGSIANVVLQGKGPEVRLTARVVFHLDRKQAGRLGREPGFGLKFLSLAAHGRERLIRLVEAAATDAGLEGSDRRTERRFPVRLKLQVKGPGMVEELLTQNLSSGGLMVTTLHPPPLGTRIDLSLTLPGREAPVHLQGTVRHHAERGGDGRVGVGISFERLDDETIGALEGYLERVAEHHRVRILLVDDTRFFRAVVGDALREAGYEVIEAATGDEAMQLLLEEILTLDLLILDIELPGLSGKEILDRLRTVGGEEDLPVLLLSGKVGYEVGAGLAGRRNASFLPKDAPIEEILQTVEDLLAAANPTNET